MKELDIKLLFDKEKLDKKGFFINLFYQEYGIDALDDYMMENNIKINDLGSIEEFNINYELKHEYDNKENKLKKILSIIANIDINTVIGNISSYGQSYDLLECLAYQDDLIGDIHKIWKEYSNNDLNPGTRRQQELLRLYKKTRNLEDISTYEDDLNTLKRFNLLIDDGYEYGTKWLYREIPEEIINNINSWEKRYLSKIEAD